MFSLDQQSTTGRVPVCYSRRYQIISMQSTRRTEAVSTKVPDDTLNSQYKSTGQQTEYCCTSSVQHQYTSLRFTAASNLLSLELQVQLFLDSRSWIFLRNLNLTDTIRTSRGLIPGVIFSSWYFGFVFFLCPQAGERHFNLQYPPLCVLFSCFRVDVQGWMERNGIVPGASSKPKFCT